MEEFMADYSKELPEECIVLRKQFEACRYAQNETGSLLPVPLHRTKGCRQLFSGFNRCVENFNFRYMNLKNMVAKINGEVQPYDIVKERELLSRNLTVNNFGLDKF